MQPTAIYQRSRRVIHTRSFSAQVIDAFQLVCAKRSVKGS